MKTRTVPGELCVSNNQATSVYGRCAPDRDADLIEIPHFHLGKQLSLVCGVQRDPAEYTLQPRDTFALALSLSGEKCAWVREHWHKEPAPYGAV